MFLIRPDPEKVAYESRVFWQAQCEDLQERLDAAKSRLDDAELQHYVNEGEYRYEKVLIDAKDNYDSAYANYLAAFTKFNWEMQHDWRSTLLLDVPAGSRPKFVIDPRAMVRPWTDDPVTWAKIFRKFKPNK
jgi:hypothetical protein